MRGYMPKLHKPRGLCINRCIWLKNAIFMIFAVFEAFSEWFLDLKVGFRGSPPNESDNHGSKTLARHQGRGPGCVVICANCLNCPVYV